MFNKIQERRWLQIEVETIAQEIGGSPISRKKYQLLSRKLDHTWEALQAKTNNLFAKTQAEGLKEQMVKLYGDLEEGLVKREVAQIKEESTSLRNGRLTRKAIKKLEVHISDLEQNHCPSIQNRRIIADAKQALFEAKAKLEGLPVKHHFETLAKHFPVPFLFPGDIEELLDVARDLYNHDIKQAKIHFAALSEEHKEQVKAHLQHLGTQLFEDPIKTIQALIATTNDIVGNGEGYPSASDIDQFFLGLKQLL